MLSQNASQSHTNSNSKSIIPLPTDAFQLSAEQHRAIQLLLLGKTMSEVANILSKDRKTLYRWKQNPHFLSEYNKQQAELVDLVNVRLHGLTNKAVDVLERHLAEGSLKAATELFKIVNLYGNVSYSVKQTDPEMIIKAQAEEIASTEMHKTPFVEMRRANDFTKKLAGDIADMLKEKYDVKTNLYELISENKE